MEIVKAISPGKYQEIGCSLSFDSLAKYAMGLTVLVTFNISVNQTPTQSFADPPISRNPASRPAHSPFTPRDAQCPWEGHNRSIIKTVDFWRTKNSCSMQPHWSQWTLSFNRQMHCDATGMYEKEIESVDKQRMWLFFKMFRAIFTTIKATEMKCLSLRLPSTMQ